MKRIETSKNKIRSINQMWNENRNKIKIEIKVGGEIVKRYHESNRKIW